MGMGVFQQKEPKNARRQPFPAPELRAEILRTPRFLSKQGSTPTLANASALYRGQNPQNREKRVSGSKNSHFRSPQKRAL